MKNTPVSHRSTITRGGLLLGLFVSCLPLLSAAAGAPGAPAVRDEAELMAARKARADNPNKPAPWWAELSQKPDNWYRTDEGRRIAANILSWQDNGGGWPLMNPTREPFTGDVSKAGPWGAKASLIKSTMNEIRFCARAFRVTGEERFRAAALGGFNFILKAQHATGGWPHNYPLQMENYTHQATLNDDEMSDLMAFLQEVPTSPELAFFGPENRQRAKDGFARGIDFLVKSQIVVNGKLTAWSQQYDEVTLEPRAARAFEPAAISGGESAAVLYVLMSVPDPSPAVVRAIEAGVQWYHDVQINGLEVVAVPPDDRMVRPNPSAPPVWARYYQIGTGRPIFVGRDAIIRYNLAEVEKERRGGYSWYNQNGTEVFKRYAEWRARQKRG